MMGVALTAALLLRGSHGYALPPGQPNIFAEGEIVDLKMNKLTSTSTLLPIENSHVPICQPNEGRKMEDQNIGQYLAGDRIESSPYRLKMKVDMYCEPLCIANLGRKEQRGVYPNLMVKAIRNNYHNNWILDNLPSASRLEDDSTIRTRYWGGFPLGFVYAGSNKSYVHNHVNIIILYNTDENDPDKARIVRFSVQPFSIRHEFESGVNLSGSDATIRDPIKSCDHTVLNGYKRHTDFEMITGPGREPQPASGMALFTYDVIWIESGSVLSATSRPLRWSNRWEVYLTMDGAIPYRIHWMSIVNSMITALLTAAIAANVLIRNLRRDLGYYKNFVTDEEKAESIIGFSWKLVYADIFRPPASPLLLAVCCGTGAQMLCTIISTAALAFLGFFHPANRGSYISGMLVLYALSGPVAGFVSVWLYKTFKGKGGGIWQKPAACTALGYPGIVFGVWLIVDLMALWNESTYAVPAKTILFLILIWLLLLTPLVCVGAYHAKKLEAIRFPIKANRNPRRIPTQPWIRQMSFSVIMAGFVNFGVVFIELKFILSAIFRGQHYHSFGFCLMMLAILIITCALLSILMDYSQICGENYHWWWRSLVTGGSTGIAVFVYSLIDFHAVFSLPTLLVHFGFMSLLSLALFLMTGFVGVSACIWFNKKMFSSIIKDKACMLTGSERQSWDQRSERTLKVLMLALVLVAIFMPMLFHPSQHESTSPSLRRLPPEASTHQLSMNDQSDRISSLDRRRLSDYFRTPVLELDDEDHSLTSLAIHDAGLDFSSSSRKVHRTQAPFMYGMSISHGIITLEKDIAGFVIYALVLVAIIALSVRVKRRSASPGGWIYRHNQRKVQKILADRRRYLREILSDPVLMQDMKCRYGDLSSLVTVVTEWQSNVFQQKKDECIKVGKRIVVPWLRMLNICLFLAVFLVVFCFEHFEKMMILTGIFIHMLDNLILYKAATKKGAPKIVERDGLFAAVGMPVIEIA